MPKRVTIVQTARPGNMDRQAEGLAISTAFSNGECNRCRHLAECSSNRDFRFPETAWCMEEKRRLLEKWKKEVEDETD